MVLQGIPPQYQYPRTLTRGAIGPLRKGCTTLILDSDGLGAARGQRSLKGPCATTQPARFPSALPDPHPAAMLLHPIYSDVMEHTVSSAFIPSRPTGVSQCGRHMRAFPYNFRVPRYIALAFSLALISPIRAQPQARFSLKEATVQAFGSYVAKTEAQNAASLRQGPFLWLDGLAEPQRATTISKLMDGGVEMRRLSVNSGGGNLTVPGGMIHDWEGIVFIPGVKLDDVLKILQDYNRQATYYAPDVEAARIESHTGDQFRVYLRFRRHKVVTVVLDTEHNITYFRDSPIRAHSRSSAIRIAQVDDLGGAKEKERAPGDDDGFLWRMETWWRMEERDGGVFVQNQVVTLTRDIPTGLAWLVEPFITNIPKETLDFTLKATRQAVLQNARN